MHFLLLCVFLMLTYNFQHFTIIIFTSTHVVHQPLLLWSTPPLMILERNPNWPTGYADNLFLHVSSKGITLAGSVHRSRTIIGVYSLVHVKRCVMSCSKASTLCRCDVRKADLLVLSCARVQRCALVSEVVTVAVWMRFKFCLVYADVTFLSVLMCMVYLLLLKAVCFLSLGVVCFVSGWSGCVGCCDFCLICDACSCKWVCRGSISVSSCKCCMFMSCVQPVAMRSAVFWIV